jgi:hypothetical protein
MGKEITNARMRGSAPKSPRRRADFLAQTAAACKNARGETMMKAKTAYRCVACWDLALTLPFALPFVNVRAMALLHALNDVLSAQRLFPAFQGLHMFFAQLFGIMAVLWAAVRIHKPSAYLALYDSIGRFVVAFLMVSFSLSGGSFVPMLFSVSEIVFGVAQAWLLATTRKAEA